MKRPSILPERNRNNPARTLKPSEGFISHKPLMCISFVAVSCRLYYMIIIDLPALRNAAWLGALMGLALASPALLSGYFLLRKYGRMETAVRKATSPVCLSVFCALAALVLTFEAGTALRMLSGSASYASLYDTPYWVLTLPAGIACTIAAARGGNAVGGPAAAWLRIAPALYVIVLIVEADEMQFKLLTPILGPGAHALFNCALYCVSSFCLIPLAYMAGSGEIVYARNQTRVAKPQSILYLALACTLFVIVLSVFHASLTPTLTGMSNDRPARLDLLLSNGRTSRAVQLPMLLMWYGSQALMAVFMIYVAGRLLTLVWARAAVWYAPIIGACAFAISPFALADRASTLIVAKYSPLLTGGFFIVCLAASIIKPLFKKGGQRA